MADVPTTHEQGDAAADTEAAASVSALADRLEDFVRSAFAVDPADPWFDRDVDLFDAGYVDSVGLTELLAFIAEEFGVDVPDDRLLSDDFASIHGMAQVIGQALPATESR